ncbi:hypothetical protein [Streptomyces sp. SP17KL33]|uniref:hypothetical protein n=1 Tax=Streptomyces sp. SP17KL33 TaxID=3002534 RepID=UPI002E779667|nr:hypothetical protein [Streptomyces sp. SP17KL33]MEE1829326.1 hypothetical protein [Streptomyces sp. SP17KL33]
MTPAIDAHVRLDAHPTHPSAVQAVLTGAQAHIALVALEAADWSVAATNLLVLAVTEHASWPVWPGTALSHTYCQETLQLTHFHQSDLYASGTVKRVALSHIRW